MSPAKAAGGCSKSCQSNRIIQQALSQLQGYAVRATISTGLHSKSCRSNDSCPATATGLHSTSCQGIETISLGLHTQSRQYSRQEDDEQCGPEVRQLSMQAGQGFWDSSLALSLSHGTSQVGSFCMSQCTLPLDLLQPQTPSCVSDDLVHAQL